MSARTASAIVRATSCSEGQMSPQVDVVALLVLAERLADDVGVHGSGERVGHAQRRGRRGSSSSRPG